MFPVALNAIVMLLLAVAINYPFRWRRYPSVLITRANNKNTANAMVSEEDHRNFRDAVRSLDSFVDVSEEDLVYLSRMMANHFADRRASSTGDGASDYAVRT